ncbi:MAG: 4-hydroxy-3-methylbut-2-enyl diphosphate reductase [Candidatus Moranbacteria bacterium]|nr:4-hydroxy-3-methylbut-2-enyl diphosphate reductase [Candidatus Moranbacteria bacterium]
MHTVKKILLASPRGFCAGVARAVKAVEDTLEIFGAPVYVKHEIVHNTHVVAALHQKGAITIEDLKEAPEGAVVVFSAHGSPRAHYVEARARQVRLIDATCPLVTKVHLEVQRFLKDGYTIVYIGHKGHVEGIGVLGEVPEAKIPVVETVAGVAALAIGNPEKLVYLTQTTLSIDDTRAVIDALKERYPQIVAPPLEDICYATTNRQTAVKELAKVTELVLIVGSASSSNSTRLMETARAYGATAYLVNDVTALDPQWFVGVATVGISAGASAPEHLVQDIVEHIAIEGVVVEDFIVKPETMKFSEPLELMKIRAELNKNQA